MSLMNFPDVCILLIFDHLPVKDLLSVNKVCRQWYLLQPVACRLRKSLSLLVGPYPMYIIDDSSFVTNNTIDQVRAFHDHIEFSSIRIAIFNRNIAEKLIRRFGSITSLTLILFKNFNKNIWNMDSVIYLLGHLGAKLESFKLWSSGSHCDLVNVTHSQYYDLCKVVNSMASLKRLVFFPDYFIRSIKVDLPIVSQLEEFYFFTLLDKVGLLDDLLKQYAEPSDRLRQIGFGMYINYNELLRIGKQYPRMVTRVTHLNTTRLSIEKLPFICTTFTSLVYLEIDAIKLASVTNCLSSLHNLRVLNWLIHFPLEDTEATEEEKQCVQLPQIETLKLKCTLVGHSDLHSLHLAWIFPRVVHMQIVARFERICAECKKQKLKRDDTRCAPFLVQPLAQCLHLCKLTTNLPINNVDNSKVIEIENVM